MARLREIPFVKGHGTGNDFVILPDLDGRLELSPADVAWLCHRRFGIGADGILRVVRTARMPGFELDAVQAEYFMDYRNADGTVAEMCGNGARVFVRYLDAVGLITDNTARIATRAGVLDVSLDSSGEVPMVSVAMGHAMPPRARAMPVVEVDGASWPATGVIVPNPHAVAFVESLDDAGSLHSAPVVAPADVFPDGVNVEFVVSRGPRHVAMRVHERGSGETMACGTGACAVAWAARRRDEPDLSGASTWQVDMPGGTVFVAEAADGGLTLTGPADLVARGSVLLP